MTSSSGKKRGLVRQLVFAVIPAVALLLLIYSVWTIHRTNQFYNYLKTGQKGFEGRIFNFDPVLGYAPAPRSEGFEIPEPGREVPVFFDEGGFRVPSSQDSRQFKRPLILDLGCSFTFGAGVPAEAAFAHLTALGLQGRELNAGVPAYGLAQMLILASKLIPEYRPDIVIVQFSSWLVDRAQSPFGISSNGKMPVPYFVDGPDNTLLVHPPVFAAKVFDLPISRFRHTPKTITDYLVFLVRVALPLYMHDDVNMAIYYFKLATGIIPRPTDNREKMVRVAYMDIARLCQENHSRLVIVILHDPLIREPTLGELLRIDSIESATGVDTGPALISRLPSKSAREFYTLYGKVAGSPPAVVNAHPNEIAHRVIAEEILKAIAK